MALRFASFSSRGTKTSRKTLSVINADGLGNQRESQQSAAAVTISATSPSGFLQRKSTMTLMAALNAHVRFRSGGASEASVDQWNVEEMLDSPTRHSTMYNIGRHVLFKRSFLMPLLIAAFSTAIPAVISAVEIPTGLQIPASENPDDKVYTVFSTLVSFFIVIRAGEALTRLKEASTMVYGILGDWSDAVSSLLSFTRKAKMNGETVRSFQNMLVILVSMLNALCLAELEGTSDSKAFDYNLVNFVGFPTDALAEISRAERKVETVFQMIQAMIVDNMDNGILNVPSPILTRSFQEMSQAMLKVHEAHKLVHVPYPSGLNAASTLFLVVHTGLTVHFIPTWMNRGPIAFGTIFILVFSYWFVHFVCGELEQPFSSSCTAIDLAQVQDELNSRLRCFVQGARRESLELRAEVAKTSDAHPPFERSVRGLVQIFGDDANEEAYRGESSLSGDARSTGTARSEGSELRSLYQRSATPHRLKGSDEALHNRSKGSDETLQRLSPSLGSIGEEDRKSETRMRMLARSATPHRLKFEEPQLRRTSTCPDSFHIHSSASPCKRAEAAEAADALGPWPSHQHYAPATVDEPEGRTPSGHACRFAGTNGQASPRSPRSPRSPGTAAEEFSRSL